MGFNYSFLAVKGRTREEVLTILELQGTGEHCEVPSEQIGGALLSSGWYLILELDGDLDLMRSSMLKHMSQGADAIVFSVSEVAMCSWASAWTNGQEKWSISHGGEASADDLDASGDLPSGFATIRDRYVAEQKAAEGKQAGVDHMIDIPRDVVAELIGFNYEEDMAELGENPYEILLPRKKRPWWKRLIS